MELGKYNRARVEEIMPQGYYLELETGGRVLLPGKKEEFTLSEGEVLDVFVYMDSDPSPLSTSPTLPSVNLRFSKSRTLTALAHSWIGV